MSINNLFEEVENDIKENTPPIIYKYRTWENNSHKKIITENQVWFAHPHTLNDPHDIRPPYNFIIDNIDWSAVKRRIIAAARSFQPLLSDEQLSLEVEKRLIQIKNNPVEYFQNNRSEYLLDKTRYDNIGVFSCCSSFSNEVMWAHYGGNHNGLAVGFNTVELARTLSCTLGYVDYNDNPIDYQIFGNNKGLIAKEIFRKSTKWSYEEEIRFITVGIGKNQSKAITYPLNAASEIVFGIKTSKDIQEEIISIAKEKLPNIPFYKLKLNSNQYGFSKIKL